MTLDSVSLDVLSQLIRGAGRPLFITELTKAAVRSWLESGATERTYAPSAHYRVGENVLFKGQRATVKAAQPASNPVQGEFSVLTLVLPDGTELLMAADVPDAPADHRHPQRQEVTEAQVDDALRSQGAAARRAVRAALVGDSRFVPCDSPQGELWCLVEMLPEVTPAHVDKVRASLEEEQPGDELISRTTEQLVEAVWGQRDDGGPAYALRAFALRRALAACNDAVCLGDQWTSAEEWRSFTDRAGLAAPSQSTRVTLPDGIEQADEAEVARESRREMDGDGEEKSPPEEEDLETWREGRPMHAVFTLRARHYYDGWLPLSGQMRRLFPPLASGLQEVTFHHEFGGEPETFRAWVDREQGRIWVSPAMYETFRSHGIYPGARLQVGARNEREYDIATREATKTAPIRVWRMWLDEDGQIQYEEYEEPRRYDVEDDVYVADVRFEDRKALFEQAAEAGNSIFGLMYAKAVEWWEAGGRKDLVVTAHPLFEALQSDPQARMTSPATVAWELWKRLAFEPQGGGRYVFRPGFGEHARSASQAPRRRARSDQTSSSCWRLIHQLSGRELQTLDQGHRFVVLEVDDGQLRLQVKSTGKSRTIERERIEAAWKHLTDTGTMDLAAAGQFTTVNRTYVLALLAALPGVSHSAHPIILRYQAQPPGRPQRAASSGGVTKGHSEDAPPAEAPCDQTAVLATAASAVSGGPGHGSAAPSVQVETEPAYFIFASEPGPGVARVHPFSCRPYSLWKYSDKGERISEALAITIAFDASERTVISRAETQLGELEYSGSGNAPSGRRPSPIPTGARVVHYDRRTGAFFGVSSIAEVSEAGVVLRWIVQGAFRTDQFAVWEPTLPLDSELGNRLSFPSGRGDPLRRDENLGRIAQVDYDTLIEAQAYLAAGQTWPAIAEGAELWSHFETLPGTPIETLSHHSSVLVVDVSPSAITLQLKGGSHLSIRHGQIWAAWRILTRSGRLTRTQLDQLTCGAQYLYVAALLARIPGVDASHFADYLEYTQPAAPVSSVALERTRTGQLVAPGLVPPGPLFETPAQAGEPPRPAQVPGGKASQPTIPPVVLRGHEPEFREQKELIADHLRAHGLPLEEDGTVYYLPERLAITLLSSGHKDGGYWFGPSPGVLERARKYRTYFMLLLLDSAETVLVLPRDVVEPALSKALPKSGHHHLHINHQAGRYLLKEVKEEGGRDVTVYLNAYDQMLTAAGDSTGPGGTPPGGAARDAEKLEPRIEDQFRRSSGLPARR